MPASGGGSSTKQAAAAAGGGHGHGAGAAAAPHVGRKLAHIAQAARGREALKYELEVIPFFAGELPGGLQRVCFTWERGSKVFSTAVEPVNPATHAVFFQHFLKQTATMYRDAGRLLPKEYTFKLQHVRGAGAGGPEAAAAASTGSRKTIGKVKLDLAQFCSDAAGVPQEVFLQLKPVGKVKLSIKATWLKDARVEMDALTELSFGTHRSTEAGEALQDSDEQDLSGFDGVDEVAQRVHSHLQQTSTSGGSPRRGAAGAIPAYRGAGSGAAEPGRPGAESPRGSVKAASAGSKLRPPSLVPPVPGATQPFSVGLSPQAEAERAAWLAEERARREVFQRAESAQIRRTIEDQLRFELNDVLAQHASFSWRRLLCCCWPQSRAARLRTTQELAALQREAEGGGGGGGGGGGDMELLNPSPLPL